MERESQLQIHYNGCFIYKPEPVYVGGKISTISVDHDRMSHIEMVDIIEELGCPKTCNVYHKLPDFGFDGSLRDLKTDLDVLDMFACHNGRKNIPIFVENQEKYPTSVDEGAIPEGPISLDETNSEYSHSSCENNFAYFADGDKLGDEISEDDKLVESGASKSKTISSEKVDRVGSSKGSGKGMRKWIVTTTVRSSRVQLILMMTTSLLISTQNFMRNATWITQI